MVKIFFDLSDSESVLPSELRKAGGFVISEAKDSSDVIITDKKDCTAEKTRVLRIISDARLDEAEADSADDIIFSPISLMELKVRISRLIAPENRLFEKGELKIDLTRALVTVKGERIHLTLIEYRFLALLAESYGRIVPYKEILSSLWECPLGNEMLSVRVFVNAIRRKFAAAGATEAHIITHAAKGYELK